MIDLFEYDMKKKKGRNMNKNQKIILSIGCLILIGMLLFPPFAIHRQGSAVMNQGFAFITNPPHMKATVNISQLILQEIIVTIVSAASFFIAKD